PGAALPYPGHARVRAAVARVPAGGGAHHGRLPRPGPGTRRPARRRGRAEQPRLGDPALYAADLVDAGLADRLAVDLAPANGPAYGTSGQSVAVGHADSAAVLAQLRLAQVEAIRLAPAVLAAVGMAELARAFCGEARWTT